jgi:hypothetical protein
MSEQMVEEGEKLERENSTSEISQLLIFQMLSSQ